MLTVIRIDLSEFQSQKHGKVVNSDACPKHMLVARFFVIFSSVFPAISSFSN